MKEFGKESNEFKEFMNELQIIREKKKEVYLERAIKGLRQLNKYAKNKGIKLGIENRYFYFEIPNYQEIKIFLDEFPKNSSVHYWHDVGHAQVHEYLGIAKHEDYLKDYNDRIIGIHLHDIIAEKNHQAPSNGMMDFEMIKKYLPKNALKVMEINAKVSHLDIKNGYNFLRKIFKNE
jgi:sugar phosphate isomerase/epimerase